MADEGLRAAVDITAETVYSLTDKVAELEEEERAQGCLIRRLEQHIELLTMAHKDLDELSSDLQRQLDAASRDNQVKTVEWVRDELMRGFGLGKREVSNIDFRVLIDKLKGN